MECLQNGPTEVDLMANGLGWYAACHKYKMTLGMGKGNSWVEYGNSPMFRTDAGTVLLGFDPEGLGE